MGTDLVYEQTQVQLKSKMYTVSEVEGNFHMDGYDNIMLSLNLPLKRLEIFSLEWVYKWSVEKKCKIAPLSWMSVPY